MPLPFFDFINKKINIDSLTNASARKLAALVNSNLLDDVEFIQCMTNEEHSVEAIIVDIHVPIGQKKTINDIRLLERVAITFEQRVCVPAAYPLREDFPFHLPHVNVVPGRSPRSLCLSSQPEEDQLRSYTAISFLSQIRWWFEESAYAKLHGEEQPLDPVFHASAHQFIASEKINEAEYLIGIRNSPHENAPIILSPMSEEVYSKTAGQIGLMTPIYVKTGPVKHGQINWLPLNLLDLIKIYEELGCNLLEKITSRLIELLKLKFHDRLFEQPLVIMVETEIKSDDGRSLVQRKIYVAMISAGDVADKLGVVANEGGNWARLIGGCQASEATLSSIKLATADLHNHFTRNIAAVSSGYDCIDKRNIVLIGAGAIGSHVSMNLARGGVGIWHVIDNDFFLPHNQARIQLDPEALGAAKADELALKINRLFQNPDAAKPHVEILKTTKPSDDVKNSFDNADAIIDASASVPVARCLAHDIKCDAPVASMFMNPTGSDAVLLSEAFDRSVKIDCVEMHYYWVISSNPDLKGHLQAGDKPLPIGGCRSPSAQISEPRVALNSALLAGRWLKDGLLKTPQITIWRGQEEFGDVSCYNEVVPKYAEVDMGDWTVKFNYTIVQQAEFLRQKSAPKETGGIIAGSWDRQRNIIYLVGIYDPPPNSTHSATGFERGSVGVHKTIKELHQSTLGNLTYVGEWHSHPPGVKASPSTDDRKLLKWIGDILEHSEAPGMMLIAGEDGLRVILRDEGEDHETVIKK